jgi:Ca-activated chloride channel family protein
MNFGDPIWFRLLWLLPGLALACAWLYRRRRAALRAMFSDAALEQLASGFRARRRAWRLAIWCAALALLLFSLARPQWGFRWEQATRRGLDILVLLDTSRSMLAADFKPTRLQQAKWGIRDFARSLNGDRIGLIPFAGTAFLMCPLTIDYAAFLMSLDDAHVGIVPRGGTAIAAALRVAVETFDKQSAGDRAIVLVSDGEDHEGKIENWIPALKERNIRIFAVGVGAKEGEPLPAPDGSPGFQKDREGNVVLSALREEPLRMLALETGGAYVRAAPGDLALDRVLAEHLQPLTRAESDSRLAKVREERAGWFIGLGVLLLVAESALRERVGRAPS